MKTNQTNRKTSPRTALFSCGFFRQCTQTVLSPTTTTPPPLPHAPPQQPPSSSSSSSNTSQSFTQWKFPLSTSPTSHHSAIKTEQIPEKETTQPPPPPPPNFQELFNMVGPQFSSGSETARMAAVRVLEKSLVPHALASGHGGGACAAVIGGVVDCLRDGLARKAASKVLLALCLVEENRRVALEAGAVNAVVVALTDAESSVAERSLASLELLCTLSEGAEEVRSHALAVPMMVEVMGRMGGRGKEHAIGVLAVIYGGLDEGAAVAPAEEVARAVVLALGGECSDRGRRKGAQLLKILKESGRSDLAVED